MNGFGKKQNIQLCSHYEIPNSLAAHENILVFSKYPSAQNSAKKYGFTTHNFTIAEPYNRKVKD